MRDAKMESHDGGSEDGRIRNAGDETAVDERESSKFEAKEVWKSRKGDRFS